MGLLHCSRVGSKTYFSEESINKLLLLIKFENNKNLLDYKYSFERTTPKNESHISLDPMKTF